MIGVLGYGRGVATSSWRALALVSLLLATTLAFAAGNAQAAETMQISSYGKFYAEVLGVAVDQSSGDLFTTSPVFYCATNEVGEHGAQACGFGGRTKQFDAEGKPIKTISPEGFRSAIAVNPVNKRLYLLNALLGSIEVIDPVTNEVLSSFPVTPSKNLLGLTFVQIATDSAGDVYVPAAKNHAVNEYSEAGTLLKTFKPSGALELIEPDGVAVDSANDVWVADRGADRIEEMSSSGEPLSEIKSLGVVNVALDSEGNVFALVNNRADACGVFVAPCSHVMIYNSTGAQIADFGAGSIISEQFDEGYLTNQMTVNPSTDRIYVSEMEHGHVYMFGPGRAPTVGNELAVDVTDTEADLGALVNAGALPSTYSFEYGTTTAYGSAAPAREGFVSGAKTQPVWAPVAGLAPGTTYHFRVVVRNAVGTVDGADQTFTTTAAHGACANEALRGGLSAGLPDCRAYEMVTQPNTGSAQPDSRKGAGLQGAGGFAYSGGGFEINHAARNGDRFAYMSLEVMPNSESSGSQYLSTRTADGWSSENVIPLQSYDNIFCTEAQWGNAIKAWSEQLTERVLRTGASEQSGQESSVPSNAKGGCGSDDVEVVKGEPLGVENLLLHDTVGEYQLINSYPNGKIPTDAHFEAATADLSRAFFKETTQLTEDGPAGQKGLYEWHGGALRIVSVLPNGTPVGGSLAMSWQAHPSVISSDGSRVLFTAGGNLYQRVDGEQTVQLDAPRGGAGPGGGGVLGDASADGKQVYFVDEASAGLTADTAPGSGLNLYRYTEGQLTDITPVEHAKIAQVLGLSSESVYFTSTSVLTGSQSNQGGETAQPFRENIYEWRNGVTTFISSMGEFTIYGTVSPNGNFLAFSTGAKPTGYDNVDQQDGHGDSEIYLYDASTKALACASCNPSGEPPSDGEQDESGEFGGAILPETYRRFSESSVEPLTIQEATSGQGAPHNLSDDGRVVFQTREALLPSDTNGKLDVYEYEEGQLHLISSGTAASESRLLDVSEEGKDIFFVSRQPLVEQDLGGEGETNIIYDAREGGGFPLIASPPACTTVEACREPAGAQPVIYGAPSSQTFSGQGNLAPPVAPHRSQAKEEGEMQGAPRAQARRMRPAEVREEGKKEQPEGEALVMGISRKLSRTAAILLVGMFGGAAPALAEEHPAQSSFGAFSNPNGIAVDEATGDVYVADIGADTVYKFDASGNPVNFSTLASNELTGSASPQKTFSFSPGENTPAAVTVDNACVDHTPALTGSTCSAFDPSAGDLYVLDEADKVVDKFGSGGEYLGQLSGPNSNWSLDGVGVDGKGDVRVHVDGDFSGKTEVEIFDNSILNAYSHSLGHVSFLPRDGLAVAPNGDMYTREVECACLVKRGANLERLGMVESEPSDVGAAVDPTTGHLYVDEQSTVAEFDTGTMNGDKLTTIGKSLIPSAAAVSTFGATQLGSNSSGHGGIGVNGQTGEIYVSSPADGKVYLYGTTTPAAGAAAAGGLTKTTATLNGTVDPRGHAVTSCRFEYEEVKDYKIEYTFLTAPVEIYRHSVPCDQAPAAIGSGTVRVPVSAEVRELETGRLYDYRVVAENASGATFAGERFATESAGFGFKDFTVTFLNEDGEPDTQAGSHPYEMDVNIGLNRRIIPREKSADSRYVSLSDGSIRNIITELPPGLVGDPNATAKKCAVVELEREKCPEESMIGDLAVEFGSEYALPPGIAGPIYNMVPPHGVAVQFGVNYIIPNAFIDSGVQAGGDYPVRSISPEITALAPLTEARLKVLGIVGSGSSRKPFLTLPTGCKGPLKAKISGDSYQSAGHFVEKTVPITDPAGQPLVLGGCSKLKFPVAMSVAPDTTNASAASGLNVTVHVPQKSAFNPEGLAESSLRDTTVTLPEGVSINPAGSGGLEACSEGLAGFTGFKEFNPEHEAGVQTATFTPTLSDPLLPGANFCPNGSKIGTVKISTPLLSNPIEGAVYLAQQNQNPFGGLVAMYMIAEDPVSGTVIKLTGEVKLTDTGQIVTTFKNTPDLPFEDLTLHFFGGERSPLSTPSRCGTYTTEGVFTPWDGNPPTKVTSSFVIDHGPGGGPCPGSSLPFSPSLTAGTSNIQAGAFSPFTMTMSRPDGDQNLDAIKLKMPLGLEGTLTGVELCGEPRADEGTCGPNSLIGETIVSVGVGSSPFTVTGGKVYLTGPYKGAPFGLSIVNPAKAGPFDLENTPLNHPGCDCLVVRAKIEVDPVTTALTITSDTTGPYRIPTMIEGIPLQIQHVNVSITRPSFTFNPTNCSPMAITGELTSSEDATDSVSLPFQVTNCGSLSFKPGFNVSTSGHTSRAAGASLHVKLTYPKAPYGTQANIRSVRVELPKQLPSRLTTLNHACIAATFEQNPANCPSQSRVGTAKAITPLIPVPLEGPAYFVSHGGQKFPELVVVLQGYGVTLDLHGETFISKAGITSSTFHQVPDAPVGSFELNLPEGPFSALAANTNLCNITTTKITKRKVPRTVHGRRRKVTIKVRKTVPGALTMPTTFTAQNGAVIHQNTPIAVTSCARHKAAKKAGTRRKHH